MKPTDSGLDLRTLSRFREPRRDLDLLHNRIGRHLDHVDGYLAFSGGKDSTVVLDLARKVDPQVPVCFFDSGLEFPETLTYINDLAELWSLNLHIIPAIPSALEYLRATGSWQHGPTEQQRPKQSFHEILISRPAAAAHAAHGPGELWGIRAQESKGRRIMLLKALRTEIDRSCTCCPPSPRGAHSSRQRARHGGLVRRLDSTEAYSPIWDWSTSEIHAYLAAQGISPNPIYQRLRDLGAPEFLQRVSIAVDANNIGFGRITWLRAGWPDLYQKIQAELPRIQEFA